MRNSKEASEAGAEPEEGRRERTGRPQSLTGHGEGLGFFSE